LHNASSPETHKDDTTRTERKRPAEGKRLIIPILGTLVAVALLLIGILAAVSRLNGRGDDIADVSPTPDVSALPSASETPMSTPDYPSWVEDIPELPAANSLASFLDFDFTNKKGYTWEELIEEKRGSKPMQELAKFPKNLTFCVGDSVLVGVNNGKAVVTIFPSDSNSTLADALEMANIGINEPTVVDLHNSPNITYTFYKVDNVYHAFISERENVSDTRLDNSFVTLVAMYTDPKYCALLNGDEEVDVIQNPGDTINVQGSSGSEQGNVSWIDDIPTIPDAFTPSTDLSNWKEEETAENWGPGMTAAEYANQYDLAGLEGISNSNDVTYYTGKGVTTIGYDGGNAVFFGTYFTDNMSMPDFMENRKATTALIVQLKELPQSFYAIYKNNGAYCVIASISGNEYEYENSYVIAHSMYASPEYCSVLNGQHEVNVIYNPNQQNALGTGEVQGTQSINPYNQADWIGSIPETYTYFGEIPTYGEKVETPYGELMKWAGFPNVPELNYMVTEATLESGEEIEACYGYTTDGLIVYAERWNDWKDTIGEAYGDFIEREPLIIKRNNGDYLLLYSIDNGDGTSNYAMYVTKKTFSSDYREWEIKGYIFSKGPTYVNFLNGTEKVDVISVPHVEADWLISVPFVEGGTGNPEMLDELYGPSKSYLQYSDDMAYYGMAKSENYHYGVINDDFATYYSVWDDSGNLLGYVEKENRDTPLYAGEYRLVLGDTPLICERKDGLRYLVYQREDDRGYEVLLTKSDGTPYYNQGWEWLASYYVYDTRAFDFMSGAEEVEIISVPGSGASSD